MEEDASALYRWARSPEIGPRAGWPPHRDVAESRNSIRAVLKRPEIYAIVLRDTAEPIGSVGLQNFRLADADGSLLTFFDERKSEDPLVCSRPGRIWEDADETDSICSVSEAVQSADSRSETVQSAGMIGDMGSACMDNTGGLGLPSGVCVEAALGYWLAEPYQGKGIMHEAAEALLLHAKRDLGLRRVWADYYEGNDNSRKVMERLGFHYHHIEKDRYVEAMKERRTAIVYVTDLTHI
jgi:RimJ/RimL family protein N-acetyltransferase